MRSWMTSTLLIAAFMVSAQAPRAGELIPNVVVTVPALKPYVDEVLAGITESKSLLHPGQDAHSFGLSSSQRTDLANADIIIIADRGMSPFLNKLLTAEAKRGAVIIALTSLKNAEPLPFAKTNPWLEAAKEKAAPDEDKKDDHEHHEHADADKKTADASEPVDPHIWLDPIRMANIAEPIANIIAKSSPNHRATLRSNANALAKHLRNDVDPAIRRMVANSNPQKQLSTKPIIPFITYHAAYHYFILRYGLEHHGELFQRPEDYLGARTMHSIIAQSNKVKINCLIAETKGPLTSRIAKTSGAKIVVLSPEEPMTKAELNSASWARNDYERMLQKTAESFAGCL